MAKVDVLDILRAKKQSPLEFNFDNLWIPPMEFFLTPDDVESLRRIATSLRLSSKIELKYKMIDDIMRNRGFRRFSAGTNRVVYSFLEDNRFVVKIAVDKVGMQDNPMEYENQFLLKPYCAKMFYISPCGTVGFAERVLPIKNKEEFRQIASDVFDVLVHKILGEYVMEDIGTKYFMNYGIRYGYGPVLLDYPFLYKLDGKKLFCNKVNPATNEPCNGEIDYDCGFNHLVCARCGKIYLATDLRDDSVDNKIIIKGGIQMKIMLKKGNEIISKPIAADDVMVRPTTKPDYKSNGLVVKISGNALKDKCKENDANVVETPKTDNYEGNWKSDSNIENDSVDSKKETDNAVNVDNDSNTEAGQSDIALNNDSNAEENSESDKNPKEDTDNSNVEQNEEEAKADDTVDNASKEDASTDEDTDNIDTAKKTTPKKSTVAKKKTASVSVVNESSQDEDKNTDIADSDALSEKYSDLGLNDDESSFSPIRKKKSTPERDSNGRFVSTKGGKKNTKTGSKTSSTFIPSN